jgi:hypothetical protein
MEKSPSRIAASRFEMVWSGRTTRSRSARENPSHARAISRERVQRTFGVKSPVHRSTTATTVAGRAAKSDRRKTRRS